MSASTSWMTDYLRDVADVYGENAHAKFPDSTPTKAALHLAEEANELIGAVLGLSSHTPAQEAAAIFLVLSHVCHMAGIDCRRSTWRCRCGSG